MRAACTAVIDVWSDYVCPFCYLELPILDRLSAEWGDTVQVRWHAFELRPEPAPTLDPGGEYLRTTWARSVYPMAEQRGLVLRLPPVQPRSRKAFEAAEFARAAGRFNGMHLAIFQAFFCDGRDIGSMEVLADIGLAIGLDPDALLVALEQDLWAERVRLDQQEARRLGVAGVPLMIVRPGNALFEEGLRLSGTQPYEALEAAVSRVEAHMA